MSTSTPKNRAVKLVALRELREGARKRANRIVFAVMMIGVVGAAVVPGMFADDDDTIAVGLVDTVAVDAQLLEAAGEPADMNVEVETFGDVTDAEDAVMDGEIDAALAGDIGAPELVAEQQPDPALQAMVSSVLADLQLQQQLADVGVSPDDFTSAAGSELTVRELDGDELDSGAFLFAMISTVFLFLAVTLFGSQVLSGVVEEKSSRVVEVILGAMRPEQLLAGKLLGVGTLALIQVLAVVAVGVGAVAVTGSVEMPETTISFAIGVLVWFVVGFAFFSTIYAAAGALVSRMEDAQGTSGPISMLFTVAYLVTVVVVMPNPDGFVAQVLSFVPGFAPLAVPARMAFGVIEWWQIVVALVVNLAALYGAVQIAAKIYRRSLLRTQKASWMEVLRPKPAQS